MSQVFAFAAQQWRAMRADFEIVREAAYRAALDDCNGVLLNTRGRKAGIDPYSLFMGNDTRARAYASRELIDHWDRHVRPTLAAFERQMFEPQPDKEQAA